MAQPLYPTAQIRAIEQAHGSAGLMEKAGLAAATLAGDLLGSDGVSILVIAGPGNNGGDALVAARHLLHGWQKVTVVFAGERDQLPPDATAAYDAWLAVGGTIQTEIPPDEYDLVIDGLFGIGLQRPLEGRYADLVYAINALGLPVLALDVPSGLCADTGRVLGVAVRADHTLTFLGLKPGLFTLHGPDHAGTVHVTDLGVDTYSLSGQTEISITQAVRPEPAEGQTGASTSSARTESVIAAAAAPGWLIDTTPALPPVRKRNSHKGDYGNVGVLGGDTSMTGAALMTARAALLGGAGRIYCGLLADNAPAVDTTQPELMLRSVRTLFDLDHLSVLAVGPGMGRSHHAETALQRAIHYPAPLLLDADALHLLAGSAELRQQLCQRSRASIVTPHPGEAAALLECPTADIQADRIAAALNIAQTYHAVTVLKGCGSIVATPDGRWFVNASGNAGLASAGMGDVLSGLIAGLLAQGMDAEAATLLGVYLHGAAADSLVAAGVGPIGLTASEVTEEARDLLNRWINDLT